MSILPSVFLCLMSSQQLYQCVSCQQRVHCLSTVLSPLLVFPVTFHCSFQQLYHCPSIKYLTVLCPFNSCITVVGRSLGCLTTLCPLHSCFTDLPTPEKRFSLASLLFLVVHHVSLASAFRHRGLWYRCC